MLFLLLACGGSGPPSPVHPFDQDGDGFYVFTDCDDTNAASYPGANDAPYDGRDANCDGSDDYDQDGDGYRWDAHGGEDCDDTDPLVNPDGTEVPYDGADNDCDPTTSDADLDGDGSRHPADCDDADPLTFPGAVERMGDAVDNDCAGDGDGAALIRWPEAFEGIRNLRTTTFEERPVLAFVTDLVGDEGKTDEFVPLYQVGLALLDPSNPEPESLIFHGADHLDPQQTDEPTAIDVVGTSETLWFGIGVDTWLSGRHRAHLRPYVRLSQGSLSRQNGPYREFDPEDGPLAAVDIRTTSTGDVELSVGSTQQLTVFRGSVGTGEGIGGTVAVDASAGVGNPSDGEVWSCTGEGDCSSWQLADAGPFDDIPVDGARRILREHDGLVLWEDGTGAVKVEGSTAGGELFPGSQVLDADAVRVARPGQSDWLVAAAVVVSDPDDRVAIAFGPEDAGLLNVAFLQLPSPDDPVSVAVWADAKELFVAVGADGRFGYVDPLWIATFPWATPLDGS